MYQDCLMLKPTFGLLLDNFQTIFGSFSGDFQTTFRLPDHFQVRVAVMTRGISDGGVQQTSNYDLSPEGLNFM